MKRRKKPLDFMYIAPKDAYYLILSGEIKKFPDGYLNQNICKEIVRHVILDKLKMTREEICDKISYPFLNKYKLGNMRKLFDCKVYKLVGFCFPEMDIKPWELQRVSNEYWRDKNNQKEYVLWVIEKEELDINSIQDLRKITAKYVISHYGKRALTSAGGIFQLLSLVTGDRYKEWEIMNICEWDEKKAISAVKWLIEERLQWTDIQVIQNLTAKTFKDNSLGGLFKNYFNNNKLAALNLAYPNKFKRDEKNPLKLALAS